MLGITQSAALVDVDAHPVQVEVNTGEAGEPKFILVKSLAIYLSLSSFRNHL